MKRRLFWVIPISVIAIILCILSVKEHTDGIYALSSNTSVKVYVTDVEGNAISGATVTVQDNGSATTNYTGFAPTITVGYLPREEMDWFCVTVIVKCEGYIDTAVLYCVVYKNKMRTLQVRMLYDDGSLPYVIYTESPPSEYLEKLFGD